MREKPKSEYQYHVDSALNWQELAGERNNENPLPDIGQGIISALLAIAAAIHEGNQGEQHE